MIPFLSEKMASSFIASGIIQEEDYEVYSYSFEILLSTLLNFIAVCFLTIFTGTVVETLFYLLAFLPLRQLVGGYHARNHLLCFVTLMATYAIFVILLVAFPYAYMGMASVICLFVSLILIFWLAPVEDVNKPFTTDETKTLKRKSRNAVVIYALATSVMLIFIPRKEFVFAFVLGILSIALSLVAGMAKNHIRESSLPQGESE